MNSFLCKGIVTNDISIKIVKDCFYTFKEIKTFCLNLLHKCFFLKLFIAELVFKKI